MRLKLLQQNEHDSNSVAHAGEIPGFVFRVIIRAVYLWQDHVYWTDWETGSIFKAHKFGYKKGRSPIKNVAMQLFTPMDIHVYHKLTQPHGELLLLLLHCAVFFYK